MKCRVEINRSQFDARAVIVLPDNPANTCLDYVRIGTELHVFTDAELRGMIERVADDHIRRTMPWLRSCDHDGIYRQAIVDAFIAAAEADT